MSTYSYDITTDIGKIRLLIGDTDVTPASDAHFTDEEIQAFLTMAGSVHLAAAMLLEAWAATVTSSAESERIGDYSYAKKEADNKLALAKRYRDSQADIPAYAVASLDLSEGEDSDEDVE